MADNVHDIVETVMSGIVSNPDELQIKIEKTEDEDGDLKIIHVRPADEDIGKCLGKNGRNASALRRIFSIIGHIETGTRHYFKVNVPELPDDHFDT